MCDARLFAPQIAALPRRVIVPSLTGAATILDLAARILSEAPPRFALGGLSMGGIVTMEMVHQAPDRIERLALLDTNPLAERPEVQAGCAAQIAAAREGRLEAVMRDEMKPRYLAPGPNTAEILDLCMAMALDLGPDVFVDRSVALRDRADRQATLRDVRVPTLVLCGRLDRLCPVERYQLMDRLVPNSVLEVIENAGHLPVLERPAETNAALSRWLEA